MYYIYIYIITLPLYVFRHSECHLQVILNAEIRIGEK
jgi:hypothetical protein